MTTSSSWAAIRCWRSGCWTRVEAEFGVAIKLSAFLEGSATVARMAAAVRSRADAGRSAEPAPSPMTTPALFFVEPGESGMLTLRHFMRALGPAQKVVGLLPNARARASTSRDPSNHSRPGSSAPSARPRQPVPTTSPGGRWEACLRTRSPSQLRAGGDEVALLALLDAGSPAFSREAMRREMSLSQRLARQRARGARRIAATHGSRRVPRGQGGAGAAAPAPVPHRRRLRLARGAQGRLPLLLSGQRRANGSLRDGREVTEKGSHSLGWEEVHKGPLRIHEVPGGHEFDGQ